MTKFLRNGLVPIIDDLTATAAELNFNDTAQAGVAVASKTLVLGTNKNVDTLVIADGGLKLGAAAGTAVSATAAQLNRTVVTTAGVVEASKVLVVGADKNVDTLAIADSGLKLGTGAGTALTATAIEQKKSDAIPATAYQTGMEKRRFTETATAGTYTATVTIPANSLVVDVIWKNTALWTAATSATLDVGDADDANGYFAAIDLKTAPLAATPTVPTSISSLLEDTGSGAYKAMQKYSTSAQVITATVVTVGETGDAGRSSLFVTYATPTAVAATKA